MGGKLLMRPAELLTTLTTAGCRVAAENEQLKVRGPSSAPLTPELRAAIAAHKAELLALLTGEDPEVRWRVDAMRPRVSPTGVIPPMYARELSRVPADCCLSCGDPLTPGNKYNCEPCVRAAWQVLREVRGSHAATDRSVKG
jgi:hypothetical protein